jgi:preprotein translocase subunit YajC
MFFATPAYAQTTGAAAAGNDLTSLLMGPLPMVLIMFVLFYFLIIRPQQRRQKEHMAMIGNVKRGDSVVLSNGMIGKVTRVEEKEAMVEIATGVNTRVVKSMIAEVRAKGEPAPANDAKS